MTSRGCRALDKAVPAELETIVLKAVSKNPSERYATARAFADDLRRFVDNRPILARRPSLPQRLRKWARRHPSIVVAAVVLLLLVAVGSLVSAGLIRAAYQRERQRAEDAREQFELAQAAVNEMIQIGDEELAGNPMVQATRKRLLEAALGYYQQFIDRRQDDLAAQDELRETKQRVEKILADLAMLQLHRPTPMLRDPRIADELKLTAEQLEQVQAMLDAGREQIRQWGKLSAVERERHMVRLARAEDDQVRTILTTSQLERLRQLGLQLQGLAAFRDPAVIARLRLTDEQLRRLRLIEADSFVGPPPFGKGKGFGPKQPQPHERALAVLTDEQRLSWRELTGAPLIGPGFGPKHGPPP